MSLITAVLQEQDKITTEDLKKYRDELLPKLKDIRERLQMLSWALNQNFVDTYYNFTITKSLEQLNYKNRRANLLTDYEKVLVDIKEINEKFQNQAILEEINCTCKKIEEDVKTFNDLCTVVEGKSILEQANHEFGRYNYSESIIYVKDFLKKLRTLKFDGNGSKAFKNINSQAENQLALYSAQLSIEWEDIFSWTESKGAYHLTYSLSVQQSDPELIQKILMSLYATERLNAELGEFSNFFIEKLLHNVIRHNCDIYTEDDIGALVFNIKIDMNDKKKPNFNTIFNNLTAIFEFLQSTLGSQFQADKTFIEVFAESNRNKFFCKIIDDCIRNNLPSCDSSYQNYKNIVVELDSFNKFLIELKFVNADESPLNKYVNDTECVLYDKKCDKLLFDVRNLLDQSLSYGTIVVGCNLEAENDSIFDETQKEIVYDLNNPLFLPKCVISQNVKTVMTMIVEHLEESVKLPDQYGQQLVMYIKDIAVMYQCIIPRKFKSNFEHCPLDIALFFNNCFYLAHSLLGPPWRNTLPVGLATSLTTILLECIQDLRVVGLQKMSLYLQNQKNIITHKIESSELPWAQDSFDLFDIAVKFSISLMQDLKNSWSNILPKKMYELSICTLVQTLCQSMLDKIFADTKPITEDLVYMLALRFEDTLAEISTLFEEPIHLDNKIDVWSKFSKMAVLLNAQLLETAELWNKDKELSQSYSCEEIRLIIKMRFPDDKYRLKILKEIQ